MAKKKKSKSNRRKNPNLGKKTSKQAENFGDYPTNILYLNTDDITLYQAPDPKPGKGKKGKKGKKSEATLNFVMYEVTEDHNPMEDAGQIWWERTFHVHTNVGANNVKVLCPKRTFNDKCPICEYQAQLKKKKGNHKEEIKALYPRDRQLFCVIDDSDDEETIQVWDISTHLFGNLLMEKIDEDKPLAVFADMEEGYTLEVTFKQDSIGTNKFMTAVEIEFEERDELDDDLIDEAPNLDELLVALPYEELEELFFEVPPDEDDDEDDDDDDDDDDEDDEEEEEKPSRRRTRRRRKSKDDDEDDDEDDEDDDDDDDEDDEEEEKPKRRSRKGRKSRSRRASKDDDDDDDDEDEKPKRSRSRRKKSKDDDDDDEKPTTKKKKKTKKGKKSKSEECPIEDATFGKDFGEYEDCEECELYDSCYKASRKKKRRK